MIIITNVVKVEGYRYTAWERGLSQRDAEVVLDCLEAGLEAYKDDENEEGCNIIEDMIELFKAEEE